MLIKDIYTSIYFKLWLFSPHILFPPLVHIKIWVFCSGESGSSAPDRCRGRGEQQRSYPRSLIGYRARWAGRQHGSSWRTLLIYLPLFTGRPLIYCTRRALNKINVWTAVKWSAFSKLITHPSRTSHRATLIFRKL